MELAQILVVGGALFLVSLAHLITRPVNDDGHERAARREENWYPRNKR
jgi:hypothetical protein